MGERQKQKEGVTVDKRWLHCRIRGGDGGMLYSQVNGECLQIHTVANHELTAFSITTLRMVTGPASLYLREGRVYVRRVIHEVGCKLSKLIKKLISVRTGYWLPSPISSPRVFATLVSMFLTPFSLSTRNYRD